MEWAIPLLPSHHVLAYTAHSHNMLGACYDAQTSHTSLFFPFPSQPWKQRALLCSSFGSQNEQLTITRTQSPLYGASPFHQALQGTSFSSHS